MANHTTGAQRYNNRKDKIFENARRIEKERLLRGEKPNPNLTSPGEGKKYEIVKKMKSKTESIKNETRDNKMPRTKDFAPEYGHHPVTKK